MKEAQQPLKPPSLEDKVKALWIVSFEKFGDHVFAEVTVKWSWSYVFHHDIREDEGLYEDFINEMEILDAPDKFFELACSERGKKIYTSNIKIALKKIRDMVYGKGEPFHPTRKQLFKGQWFSIEDRYFAKDTFEYGYELISAGRTDVQKMAEDVWSFWTSKFSKKDRAVLDELNSIGEGMGASFEEVIKWGRVENMVGIFNKFV